MAERGVNSEEKSGKLMVGAKSSTKHRVEFQSQTGLRRSHNT